MADENNSSDTESLAPTGNGEAPPEGDPGKAAEEPQDPLTAARAEVARVRDQLLRTAADFDNYRKRSRRELQDGERRAREDLLRDMLPVFDNLERAAQHAVAAKDVQSLADGIGMVMRQFSDTLGKLGIERVQTVGKPFDPSLHEAIQHLETDQHPPGTITNEIQAGYRIGERLIRPALVVVAKMPSGSA